MSKNKNDNKTGNKNSVTNKKSNDSKNKNAATNKNAKNTGKGASNKQSAKANDKATKALILLIVGFTRLIIALVLTFVISPRFNPYSWAEHKFLWIAVFVLFLAVIYALIDVAYSIFAFLLMKTVNSTITPITVVLAIINVLAVFPILFVGLRDTVLGFIVCIVFEVVIQSVSFFFLPSLFE